MRSEKLNAYKRKRYALRRELGLKILGNRCARCGSTENLEFDHIDAKQKSYDLMTELYCYTLSKFLTELKKCQVLCHDCHALKTSKEGDNTGGGWNRRISKRGIKLPDHGLAGYGDGCRCEICVRAKYDYRVARGEVLGPQRNFGAIVHGTRAGYQKELRRGLTPCEACKKANAEARRKKPG